jgi:hypothetical protein
LKLIHDVKSARALCKTFPLTRIQTLIKQQVCILLQRLYGCYTRENDTKMAKLAAFWALREALSCKNNTEHIARCFSSVLQVTSSLQIDPLILNEVFRSLFVRNLNKEALEEVCNLYIRLMEYK